MHAFLAEALIHDCATTRCYEYTSNADMILLRHSFRKTDPMFEKCELQVKQEHDLLVPAFVEALKLFWLYGAQSGPLNEVKSALSDKDTGGGGKVVPSLGSRTYKPPHQRKSLGKLNTKSHWGMCYSFVPPLYWERFLNCADNHLA